MKTLIVAAAAAIILVGNADAAQPTCYPAGPNCSGYGYYPGYGDGVFVDGVFMDRHGNRLPAPDVPSYLQRKNGLLPTTPDAEG